MKLKESKYQKDMKKYFLLLHNLQIFYKVRNTWKTCNNFVKRVYKASQIEQEAFKEVSENL